ncbi:MAG: sulfatase [Planctomycetota bacterium]
MRKLLAVTFLVFAASSLPAKSPNFVFFLVDDLGYMDIGAYNSGTFYETPNVDRLAREGMQFTNGYAANPVCSPTRYSIMTGKYPSRVDATNYFSGRRGARFRPAPLHNDMPLEEETLAEALKKKGYRTAFLGKWHLGPTETHWPKAQGFDINVGGHSRGMPRSYFSPYKNPRLKDGPKGEHLTERLTNEALSILEKSKESPFLMYLAYYTVHTPLQAPKDLVAKYREKAKRLGLEGKPEFAEEEQVFPNGRKRQVRILQKHATYAAMVETMDRSVGRILKKLKDLGLDENTVVLFTSDNGGLSTSEGSPTSNLPLRGGKGWVYEGGIREPFLIKWPGVTKAGSRSAVPVMSIDFLPTVLEIAGTKASRSIDGVSLVPLLKGGSDFKRPLFWHYPHYSNQGGFPGGAVREGKYKLVERYEDGRVHLYDLEADIGEKRDVAKEHPELVQAMRAKLHTWYKEVDAKFLQPKKDGGAKPWQP